MHNEQKENEIISYINLFKVTQPHFATHINLEL